MGAWSRFIAWLPPSRREIRAAIDAVERRLREEIERRSRREDRCCYWSPSGYDAARGRELSSGEAGFFDRFPEARGIRLMGEPGDSKWTLVEGVFVEKEI
jgi:hypothetical protein